MPRLKECLRHASWPSLLMLGLATSAFAASQDAGARLLAAYPDKLDRIDGNDLVWKDGTRMPLSDGRPDKPFEEWLARPSPADMLRQTYPVGTLATPPPRDFDPGRARNSAFFAKMYGDCRKGEVDRNLVDVAWLPSRAKVHLKMTRINGAASALQAVSNDLDKLPRSFDLYLLPSAGTYNCRVIAGTDQISGHGYGVAIDIATTFSDYWRWIKPAADGGIAFRNRIPAEIIEIFEKHGFIWGGRWYHFDTMHFEYRPELLPPMP